MSIELAPISALLTPGGPAWSQLDASAQLSEASLKPLVDILNVGTGARLSRAGAVGPSPLPPMPELAAVAAAGSRSEHEKGDGPATASAGGAAGDANAGGDSEMDGAVDAHPDAVPAAAAATPRETLTVIRSSAVDDATDIDGPGPDEPAEEITASEVERSLGRPSSGSVMVPARGQHGAQPLPPVDGGGGRATQTLVAMPSPSVAPNLRDLSATSSFMRTLSGFLNLTEDSAVPVLATVLYASRSFVGPGRRCGWGC